jgi:hypothetical protein
MRLAQKTVEQFNPSFNYNFNIPEKWGYQPEKHIENYFELDKDSLLGIKTNLSTVSRIVHGIHEEKWGDIALKTKVERERNIISDKSFMKTNDTYDKVPYMDFRLLGKNNREEKMYYAGYSE